jgi:hypothetical protein
MKPDPASGPVEPERRGFVEIAGQMPFLVTVGAMLINRMQVTRAFAITGATLCLMFLLAVIVLA